MLINMDDIKGKLKGNGVNYDKIIESMNNLINTANKTLTALEREIVRFNQTYKEINPDLVLEITNDLDKQSDEIEQDVARIRDDIAYLEDLKEKNPNTNLTAIADRIEEIVKTHNDDIRKYNETISAELSDDIKSGLKGKYDE